SSQRHWHTHEDEFIYVVSGELTLVTDEGEQLLKPGMVAGFPAGDANGHHLINKSASDASYLEIGDRNAGDEVFYPDIDLLYKVSENGDHVFTTRDGVAY
ncbi:MAG: cupin domain-containing protein, partial [Woeseiaceae bacterium]